MSPDAQLAERITQRLVADGLIAGADASAVHEALTTGQLPRTQWREWVDAAGDAPPPGPAGGRTRSDGGRDGGRDGE